MNNDIIQRFLFENNSVRGEWVRLAQSYQTIVQQHAYPPVIQKLIGELLVVTTLLCATIKFKGRLSVQFQGNNKLKLLLAQIDQDFHLRAVAQVLTEVSEAEVVDLLKQGIMVITMDPDDNGKRYQGIVQWQGESLAQSIEGYFRDSEQLATRIWVACNSEVATGLLLQALPKKNDGMEEFDADWEHLVHLTETITETELLTLDLETILHRLYSEEEIRLFESELVTFRCNCSLKRSENALLLLGRDEVEQELKNNKEVVVTCEFCNKKYVFDKVDVANVFKNIDNPPSSHEIQ